MKIIVRIMGKMARMINSQVTIELPSKNPRLSDLFESLVKLEPKLMKLLYKNNRLNRQLIILQNGHSISLNQGLDTSLTNDDTIRLDYIGILETVGGG